ncbi:hypothetical protein RJ55_00783 [Drechmeria coniospora]|nr:hypothetical protein RJ55_00783 [Drechmeria coniospora]
MSCLCFIVPPHLLRAIAQSTHNTEDIRKRAQASLATHERMTGSLQDRGATTVQSRRTACGARFLPTPFIPQDVLTRLSMSPFVTECTRRRAARALSHLQVLEARRRVSQQGMMICILQPLTPISLSCAELAATYEDGESEANDSPYRAVYDAKKSENEIDLPGELVRAEGEARVGDKDVNLAYDNVGHVLSFYKDILGWRSLDNKNADVISSVHFGDEYENAFWDPEEMQMVFGDGGEFLGNFTGCIDVIGHELAHAITEHTSPLDYYDQSGALNEHVSDVFGIMVKQRVDNEKAVDADWLIGEGCLLPGVKGLALRSMKNPGKAYDDARFGKDPQVDNMRHYERKFDDNGGVHIYSGIPNKAFYLAAVAFGGYSWERAGQIWWKAMTGGRVPPRCTFKQFADVTVACAKDKFGEDAARTVRKAWTDVGVFKTL